MIPIFQLSKGESFAEIEVLNHKPFLTSAIATS